MEIEVIVPKERKYRGTLGAVIIGSKRGYIPILCDNPNEAFSQLASSPYEVVYFNQINIKFYDEVVEPMARQLEQEGLEKLV